MSGIYLTIVTAILLTVVNPIWNDFYNGISAAQKAVEILETDRNAVFKGVAVQICEKWVNETICPLKIKADFSEITNYAKTKKVAFFKKQVNELANYDETCQDNSQSENIVFLRYKLLVFLNPDRSWHTMAISFTPDPGKSFEEQLKACLALLNKKEGAVIIKEKQKGIK